MVVGVFVGWEDVYWDAVSFEIELAMSGQLTFCSLAMAEMTLVPAIYRKYKTSIAPESRDVAPGITSRFEVFADETFERVEVSVVLSGMRGRGC